MVSEYVEMGRGDSLIVIVVESEVVDMNDKTVENLLNCSIVHKIGLMHRTGPELHRSYRVLKGRSSTQALQNNSIRASIETKPICTSLAGSLVP